MNRDVLTARGHNGCPKPTWGAYGAIRRPALPRRRFGLRPLVVAASAAIIIGGGVGAHFFLAGSRNVVPSIEIVSPSGDSTLKTERAFVAVDVRNATLGPATPPAKGYRLYYYLDAAVPTQSGRLAVPSGGKYVSTTKMAYEWSISGVGRHVLAVQLVTEDGLVLDPPVIDSVTVTIPKGKATSPVPPSGPPTPGKAPGGS